MKKIILSVILPAVIFAKPIDDFLQKLEFEAKKENPNFQGFSEKRGEKIFTSTHVGKRGKKISCTSCHTRDLRATGENIFTGKKIKSLSQKANPKRLQDIKKVKKWFKRNFKDVYKREGSAVEKGDVLLYILKS